MKNGLLLPALPAFRLLDETRKRVRYLHDSRRTEQAQVHWCIGALVHGHHLLQGLRHPQDLDTADVALLLTWLADERQLANSTHQQAQSACVPEQQGVATKPALGGTAGAIERAAPPAGDAQPG